MSTSRIIFSILLGNVLIVLLLVLIEYLFQISPYFFNILGTSIIFFVLTLLVILWVRTKLISDQDPQLMMISGGMALIRISASLIWMSVVNNSIEVLYKSVVFEFIILYIYYLVMDVYYLSILLKNHK